MLTMTRGRIAAAVATAALSLGCAGAAQAQTQQEGLVNVSATDINVPIGVAANVCNVSANVIASASGNQVGDCDAVSDATATGGGHGSTKQEGLVNVNISDVDIPIGVAANVCNVSVNVITEATGNQAGRCDAVSDATA